MKNLILVLSILFGSLAASAQNPSVPARIGNRTACTMYVKLMRVNPGCNLTLTTTYVVPPFSVITTAAPPPGEWYDAALVSDDPMFNPMCYYQKVSVPWALCTPYGVTVTGPSCCGPNLISTWAAGGLPSSPFLIIYQ